MPRVLVYYVTICLLAASAAAQRLSPVAPAPNWTELERFQETITREAFVELLEQIYAPRGAAGGLIQVHKDRAEILTTIEPPERFTLRFARSAADAKKPPRFWRTPPELGSAPADRPLSGLHIAIDPGHLGGDWAKMEERWFQIGDSVPVAEGDMVLRVTEKLVPQLEALGARVSLVRRETGPTTPLRPGDLRPLAREVLRSNGAVDPPEVYLEPRDPTRGKTVQYQSELLFYRMTEIRHRAVLVNEQIRPDLVLCLHFDAAPWGKAEQPEFSPRNHLHALVNGCYSAGELRLDDLRHDMLARLLGGTTRLEHAMAERVVSIFARRAALPPLVYTGPNAVRVTDGPYLWARNLLANRLYRCPVVFLEPYVMNNREVWERVQAGDYEGEKVVAGSPRPSLYREYADAVAAGLAEYFAEVR